MSAVLGVEAGTRPVFTPPLDDFEPAEILAYYQSRHSVKYFPVADDDEVRRDKIDAILANRFDFNGESYQLSQSAGSPSAAPAPAFWLHNPSPDLEWLIQLHKFYYAAGLGMAYCETGDERYAAKWVELTWSWIESTPLDFLPSDVAGRRIRNWIYAHYYFVTPRRPSPVTAEFYQRFLGSLCEQAGYLRDHLSPARNHRTLELCALFWTAVVFPEFRSAAEWLEFARTELTRNMQTDLLPDGVQCELSLDYHHIVLRNYLSARRLSLMNGIAMPAEMDVLIRRALEFSMHAHTPAGEVPAVSDGDRGNFLYLLEQGHELYGSEELLYVASRGRRGRAPMRRSACFPASGYVIVRSGWGERSRYEDEQYLLFDCGPLGAGNHGHLDLLSFELAAYGRSLVVDAGRYTYDESGDVNERALFRGTASHNTVLVDGRNQTRYEPHGQRFRIRGPEPGRELRAFSSQEGFDFIHGVARSREYPVVHERRIFFLRPEYWVICDQLHASEMHTYELLFHLSHEAYGKVAGAQKGTAPRIDSPGLALAQPLDSRVTVSIEDGYVSPRYGLKLRAPVIRFSVSAAEAAFFTVLYPYASCAPGFSIEPLRTAPSAGIRIALERGGERVVDEISFPENGGFSFDRKSGGGAAMPRYSL